MLRNNGNKFLGSYWITISNEQFPDHVFILAHLFFAMYLNDWKSEHETENSLKNTMELITKIMSNNI